MKEAVTVHYLRLTTENRPLLPVCPNKLEIKKSNLVAGALNRFFYLWVGGPWGWTDKAQWSDSQWAAHALTVQLYIIYLEGTPVGYFELGKSESENAIELAYFGLAEIAIGKGIGHYSLVFAMHEGLRQADSVTVNTCSWDHPAALPNYLSRGFIETHRDVEYR